MDYILSTFSKSDYRISAEAREIVKNIMFQETAKHIELNNEILAVSNISGIQSYDVWFNQESDRLQQKGQTRCKYCDRIRNIQDHCLCRDYPEKKQSILFAKLPSNLLSDGQD